MENVVPRVGINSTPSCIPGQCANDYIARLSDGTTLSTPTCLCGSLPQRSSLWNCKSFKWSFNAYNCIQATQLHIYRQGRYNTQTVCSLYKILVMETSDSIIGMMKMGNINSKSISHLLHSVCAC